MFHVHKETSKKWNYENNTDTGGKVKRIFKQSPVTIFITCDQMMVLFCNVQGTKNQLQKK